MLDNNNLSGGGQFSAAADGQSTASFFNSVHGRFSITTVLTSPPVGTSVVAYANSASEGRWGDQSLDMGQKLAASSCRPPDAALLQTTEVHGQQAGQDDHDLGQAADTNADKPKRFHRSLPKSDKVIALARLIGSKFPKEGSKNAIAKRFTGGNEVEARSLLRQVRRYKLG